MKADARIHTREVDLQVESTGRSARGLRRGSGRFACVFFEIIFDTKNNPDAKRALPDLLHNTDITNGENIRSGDFFRKCKHACVESIERLQQALKQYGSLEDVPDSALPKVRKITNAFWPLIDHITLETGHVLLKHYVGVMDLCGKYFFCARCLSIADHLRVSRHKPNAQRSY
jgi:hypothetical protein